MIKALEIKTSMLFNLAFAINTILSCFVFFFLIIDFYLLIAAAVAEIVIHIGIPSKEAKTKIEIDPVIAETKIRTCSI